MKISKLIPIFSSCMVLCVSSCRDSGKEGFGVELSGGAVHAELGRISLKEGRPGAEWLTGSEETPAAWFPEEDVAPELRVRSTPKGEATDFIVSWQHPEGHTLSWTICRIDQLPGFSVRSTFTNGSEEPVRLKRFVLLKTPPEGMVCQGDPASWWLLPAAEYSRQAGNLAQVFPSRMDLMEQEVYGYQDMDPDDPRNRDGHWRFHEELVTLYNESDRSGIAIGAVGPAVSYVNLNFRVDSGKMYTEVVSEMDDILVDPGETRQSEEVLIVARSYREALGTIVSWIAETHQARTSTKPLFGWCSWYDHFFDVDEESVLALARTADQLRDRIPLDVIQIDLGWSKDYGDWEPNEKFPRGMESVADSIHEAGPMPGIWLSPVYTRVKKPADWYQLQRRRTTDTPIDVGSDSDPGPAREPERYYLDPTHPGTEEFIRSSTIKMKEQGYRYFKFDYNHIREHRPYDPKMTLFQVMRHLFTLYRESIGEDGYMLACGTPFRPVVGLADASRTGWDAIARWKSYPLAGDGLPTLPTDVFNAIFTTAQEAMLNQTLYHNDPDVTYLLPRAEDHLWRGPEESFDKEKHGLKWPGLQSYHSYVGLLGGMALVSEPLYEPEYQQPVALRMLEILHPPSPDKGWSMNGDIDPWGRQFGFVAERPWGHFASLVLWNKEDTASDVALDTHSLQEIGDRFHAWSFWDEEYLGIAGADFVAADITAHGCRLLRLTPVPDRKELPVVVGSNLHISMGAAELKSMESAPDGLRIVLTHAGAREGRIYVHSPVPLDVSEAEGCDAFVVSPDEHIYMVVITGRSRDLENTILLEAVDKPIDTIDEIMSSPSLIRRFESSGFELWQ